MSFWKHAAPRTVRRGHLWIAGDRIELKDLPEDLKKNRTETPAPSLRLANGEFPTLEQFKAWVAEGKIHYFIGGGNFGGQNGGSNVNE